MKKKDTSKTVIFLHLVKTAGTTLNQVLDREYPNILSFYIPKESEELFEGFKEKLKTRKPGLIRGHFEFGWHAFLSRPFVYVTILREPVARVISEYFYILGKPDHPLYDQVAAKKLSIADYVTDYNPPNAQTRKISGLTFAGNSGIPPGIEIDTGNMLEIAKENLDNYFAVVGLTEKFDETLILLKREFGWDWPVYTRKIVTGKKIPMEDIPGSTIEIIKEHNQLDLELYEYARQLFNEKIRQQGKSFSREVEKFKKRNQKQENRESKLPGYTRKIKKSMGQLKEKIKSIKGNKKERTVIFMHLPKTAGKTLNQIIENQYQPEAIYSLPLRQKIIPEAVRALRELPENKKKKIRILKGHMDFGLHTLLPKPAKYITILRDPVERVISNYYFVIGAINHPMHEITKSKSLAQWVASTQNQFNNGQVRMLAGIHFKLQKPTRQTLETAKSNLEKYFLAVGLTEKFDETVILLKRELGWDWPLYTRQNVTGKKVARENIPASTIEITKEHNQLDIELYEYAKQLFNEKIRQQDESFFKEVEKFKELNKEEEKCKIKQDRN
jgi:hypothetical protein